MGWLSCPSAIYVDSIAKYEDFDLTFVLSAITLLETCCGGFIGK